MKIGLGVLAAMMLVVGAGCAASADEGSESNESNMADDLQSDISALGETISLNCATTLPGLPQPPCLPELIVSQPATQIVKPGTNIAPGYYMQFVIKNDSKAAAGAFKIVAQDGAGKVLMTQNVAGLAAYASTSIIVYAPYECGWTRKVVVDVDNTVKELDDANNTLVRSSYCPRAL